MTQDEQHVDAFEFGYYAEKMGIRFNSCPSCQKANPVLGVHDTGPIATALAYIVGTDVLAGGMPVIALECENCGFLFLYNRQTVANKVRA
jgi:hypothetical protein